MDASPCTELPALEPTDAAALRRQLEAAGYRIATRADAWVECLLVGHGERWRGQGLDPDEALQDAVGKMLPSRLGRELLARALAPEAREVVEASPAPAMTPLPAAASEPAPQRQQVRPPGPRRVPDVDDGEEPFTPAVVIRRPEVPVEPRPSRAEAAERPRPGHYVELRPQGGERSQRPKRVLAPTMPAAGPAVDDALDELDTLRRRVSDARTEVAMMAPELQRLHFLAWICRARSVQERVPYAMDVERAVGDIARTLGDLGKLWWPGSVKALQFKATPLDAGAELGLEAGGRLHDWLEAAERAEETLEARLEATGAGRYDDYGWADRGALKPPPNRPNALLSELTGAIERYLGTVERPSFRDGPPGLRKGDEPELGRLLEWARKLRWLRGHVADADVWAATMGRIRWAVSRAPRERVGAIREALDSTFCPAQPWPTVLGQDPQAKQRRRQRRDLLATLPREASVEADDLADWLGGAFDLGTHLSNPRIAGLLYPLKERVLALDPDTLPENSRRTRKRLADLKRRLQEVSQEEAAQFRRLAEKELAALPAPPPEEEAEELPEAEVADTGDPLEAVTEEVRRFTAGKKALFVSNREDPELKGRLEEMLALELSWSVIDPRRVQSKCEAISQGSYDFVLSATGFQGHNVDSALYRASRSAGVKYVRVNRGRPRTCVQALARELGVRPG